MNDSLQTALKTATSSSFPAAETASKPLITVTDRQAIAPIPEAVLGKEGRAAITAAIATLKPETLKLTDVLTIGADAQDALGSHIEELLGMVSKDDAPVLYELFERLQGGLKDANLDELEATVRKGNEPGWLVSTLEKWNIFNPVKRLKQVADELRGMLTKKSKTLLELVKGMEAKAREEVERLVKSLSMMDRLAGGYLGSIREFGVATALSYELLDKVRAHEEQLVTRANETLDPQHIAAARDYRLLTQQLQNRALTLRTAYEQVPSELEIVSVAKGAASTTLTETANGIRQEFNDMKSALLKWHVLLSVQDLQASNAQRREITATLRRHNLSVLERVSTTAATMQGDNRLEDAVLLLDIAEGLGKLRDKLGGVAQERDKKFREAEASLAKARAVLSTLSNGTERASSNGNRLQA